MPFHDLKYEYCIIPGNWSLKLTFLHDRCFNRIFLAAQRIGWKKIYLFNAKPIFPTFYSLTLTVNLDHGTFIYRKAKNGDLDWRMEASLDGTWWCMEGYRIAESSGLVRDAPKRLAKLDFCHPSQIPVGWSWPSKAKFHLLAPYLAVLNEIWPLHASTCHLKMDWKSQFWNLHYFLLDFVEIFVN